ncbi:NYN domain-containing protein [uncultured Thiohalocapsa sp.]|uniref:NYN domain-containing protein n=1 Tax=uncultured Thiohalocapsa sp. TaxID=768990 RepID=UPI0025FF0BE6|nr:NYN domain-containing protein [uncultured Thiohalocapsa sp.]
MSSTVNDQVCLLFDFENLVRGIADTYGDESTAEHLDISLIFSLAEEYGNVVSARAYADWRLREINQFQFDLYNLGIDLVHVLAKRQKNAVDVKLAVDAIETMWELPAISTFVLVSGDRDFIHVLKALRRRGKRVVGVAPDNAVSDDFAALCDRFVSYAALRRTYAEDGATEAGGPGGRELNGARKALRRVLAREPDGILGAKIVPALRRELSPTFDVSDYGFQSLKGFLKALPDVAAIADVPGGDIVVRLAADAGKEAHKQAQDPLETLLRESGLRDYRYEVDPGRRRQILREIYRSAKAQPTFTRTQLVQLVAEASNDRTLSAAILTKYYTVLWQSRVFNIHPDQDHLPHKDRSMSFVPEIDSLSALVTFYERSVVYKARTARPDLDVAKTVELLGLAPQDADAVAYAQALLELGASAPTQTLRVPGLEIAGHVDIDGILRQIYAEFGESLSRGRIVRELRSRAALPDRALSAAQVEDMFQACVDRNLLVPGMDGVTQVYRLAPADADAAD